MRRARESDLSTIVHLLADDVLGREREQLGPPLPPGYLEAFRQLEGDARERLFVAERGGRVIGTFQLSFLRRLSRGGQWIAEIESVHVAEAERGRGVGAQLMAVALAEARAFGCQRVQLTSDKRRTDAHRFYERLGFARSHEGFKQAL